MAEKKKKEIPEAIVLELRLQGIIGIKTGKGVKQRFVIPQDDRQQPTIYELEFTRKSFSLGYDWVANQVAALQQSINKQYSSKSKRKQEEEEDEEDEQDLQDLIDEGEEVEEEDEETEGEPDENVVRLPSNRAERRHKKKKA